MAQFHISPGVITTENDYTTIVSGIATSTGGIAGSFQWGPVEQIVQISDADGLKSTFGPPNDDVYKTWYLANDFLSYSSSLQTVRVVGDLARNSISGGLGTGLTLSIVTINGVISSASIVNKGTGYQLGDTIFVIGGISLASYKVTNVDETAGVTMLEVISGGSGYTSGTGIATISQSAVLIKNKDDFENSVELPEVIGKFPGVLGNSLMLSIVRASEFDNWAYANRFVVAPSANVVQFTGNGSTKVFAANAPLPTSDYVVTVDGTTIEQGTDPGKFTVNGNTLTINTDSETITPIGKQNTFTLANTDNISTAGYVVKVDGVVQTNYTGEGNPGVGQFLLNGNNLSYGLNTRLLNGDSVTKIFVVNGVTGLAATSKILVDGNEKTIVNVAPASNNEVEITETSGNTILTFFTAPGIGKGNVVIEWGFISDAISVEYGFPKASKNNVKVFSNQTEVHAVVVDRTGKWTGEANTVLERFDYLSVVPGTTYFDGTAKYYVDAINRRSQYVRIGQELFAFGDKVLSGGVDDNVIGDGVTVGILQQGYALFKNPEDVELYHLIMTDQTPATVLYAIQNIAEIRRDLVVYVSPPMDAVVQNKGNEADDCVDYRNLLGSSSYYHIDCNWSYVYDTYNDKFRWIPTSGASAGCYALTHSTYDTWISGAGLNKGRIKNATKLAWNPNKTARDKLYTNNINPIVTFLGEGPVLFGDKTGLSTSSAFDRMNVRFLFIILEKSIAKAARYYLFEQNDEFTRNRFKNMVTPYLRTVKGRRGIDSYEVVCSEKNNTPDIVSRNEFIADIYVRPIYSINGITLNFNAVNGNVTFDEIINSN